MAIRITLADTPELLDKVFQLRHKVFTDEEQKFTPTRDGRVIDRFDAYPTSHSLAALHGDRVIGSIRICEDSAIGIPADESYDFRSHVPESAVMFSAGMYCVQSEFRSPRIALGLMQLASYLGISKGAEYAAASINPDIARLLMRMGFRQIDEVFTDPHFNLPVLPVLLNLSELNDQFLCFLRKNELHNFLDSYECSFFSRGEQIISAGESADAAYVIVDGEVEIHSANGVPLTTLGEGELLGELALFMNTHRSVNAYAASDVKLMTLNTDVFTRRLEQNPSLALKFITTLGQRFKNLNERLNAQREETVV